MSFQVTVAFTSSSARAEYIEHALPRNRVSIEGELPAEADAEGAWMVTVRVGSAAAARELCHKLVAFLAHHKPGGIVIRWVSADGAAQFATLRDGANRDAEVLATRLATTARSVLMAGKAGG